MDKETEDQFIKMLRKDNIAMQKAGNALAEAAFRVGVEFDGVHRLMLACAEWAKVRADEGGRGERHG